ncbi:MAG: hypothetical protein ABFD89_06735 [Bryobacteraceae bacterium]
MRTFTDPVSAALDLLSQNEPHTAHLALAQEFLEHPEDSELGRIANLIEPCGLLREARLALRVLLARRQVEQAEYLERPPRDADIGRLVTA